MPDDITEEESTPSANGQGSVGTDAKRWGAVHAAAVNVGGSPAITANSPALTGTPTAPTQSASDNSTKIATTAFVKNESATAQAASVDRANHTGSQAASTISDFDAAVTGSTAGAKAHDQNSDTILDSGGANEVSAATLKAHVEDSTKHAVIDDTAGATDTDKLLSADEIVSRIATHADTANLHAELDDTAGPGDTAKHWSADKTKSYVDTAVAAVDTSVAIGEVTGAGDLASLNTVNTAQIDDEAVTPSKLDNGPSDDVVAARSFYGGNTAGSLGFHALIDNILLKPSPGASEAGISKDADGLFIPTGTTAGTVCAGNDSRLNGITVPDDSVTTAKIVDVNVTTAKLADSAVTEAKIADGAVTGAKVAGGSASPGNNKSWGTDGSGTFGFHDSGGSNYDMLIFQFAGGGTALVDSDVHWWMNIGREFQIENVYVSVYDASGIAEDPSILLKDDGTTIATVGVDTAGNGNTRYGSVADTSLIAANSNLEVEVSSSGYGGSGTAADGGTIQVYGYWT